MAFVLRKAPFVLTIHTRWRDSSGDDRCIAWARDFRDTTVPYAQGVSVNFLSNEGDAHVRDAWTEQTWERLVKLKNKYDQNNLFRLNQNIPPA
ncbi:BBE domain-containing protein [Desulfofustis glycolicus]|uniref:BBE domain-containing protein n=1 Tax=Desulfofustis glycolicus TaxID=51195 RepID=UPI000A0390F5